MNTILITYNRIKELYKSQYYAHKKIVIVKYYYYKSRKNSNNVDSAHKNTIDNIRAKTGNFILINVFQCFNFTNKYNLF